MKVLKTVVATAMIVFALTTVAMAGVQRLGGGGDADARSGNVAAQPATARPAQGAVTLSAQQFAALLNAVRLDGYGARDRDRDREATRQHAKSGTPAQGTHEQDRTHAGAGRDDAAHAGSQSGGAAQSGSHHDASHTASKQHTAAATGTHDGAHDGGHDGGAGGCD